MLKLWGDGFHLVAVLFINNNLGIIVKNEFEWLKWVGLILVISILGAVVYLVQSDKGNLPKSNEVQEQDNQKEYNQQLDQITTAVGDAQVEAQQAKENPPIYEPLDLEQTTRFIDRLEKLMAEDSNVNLDYLPEVAAQSRKYNGLIEEAESIYGTNDIANSLRYCTAMVSYAREMWSLKYSKDTNTPEYKLRTQKLFLESFNDAKKACLDDVSAKVN
jgi:hypothetical protein